MIGTPSFSSPPRLACTALLAMATLIVSGCSVDFDRMRTEHAEQFSADIEAKTVELLPPGEAVDLQRCIEIALANNLDVQTTRINERLANLDRKIAFSAFLPHVSVQLAWDDANHQQQLGSNGQFNASGDRSATETIFSAQQSIFAPQTWFLYQARQKGESISKLVARRTRDLIRLQITTLYYACLSQQATGEAIAQSLQQAKAVLAEVDALAREGLAMPSQLQQARTLATAQATALSNNRLDQRETRAQLLEAMGLSPMGEITLKAEPLRELELAELAEEIFQAMLHRPELHAADRTIEIRKDETKIAIANFLPRIVGVGNFIHSNDGFLRFDDLLTFGASGVLTVFDGFANVYEYRAAKQRRSQAMVAREQSCLQIMLEVIQTRGQVDRAADALTVARQDSIAADTLAGESAAQWREGLITASEKLEAMSRQASARTNLSIAEFRYQVAAATLQDVMGLSPEGVVRDQSN